ncbi:fidgetin-like protein 1 [Asterias amurensis]|uniref:fidgetin-like protein 1 n=1 Tax=Asterias amurensis TaxID=7602 RepID=UPI003AB87AF0
METETMDEKEAEGFILQKWQKCFFDLQRPDTGPGVRADSITGILQQIYQARTTDSIDEDVHGDLARQYIKSYSAIVDSVNPETGLNNYADGALTLCANHPNESAEWTTSFTSESLKDLPCVQSLLKTSKRNAESRRPVRPNEKITLNQTTLQTKRAVDPQTSTSAPNQPGSSNLRGSTSSTNSSMSLNPPSNPLSSSSYPPGRPSGSSTNATNHPPGQSSRNSGQSLRPSDPAAAFQETTNRGTFPQPPATNLQTPWQGGHHGVLNAAAPPPNKRAPVGSYSAPHQPVPAFASRATANRSENQGPLNRNPGFPSHQGPRQSVFNTTGAPPQTLKRKTMFQEVEYNGDGQLPFRTSVPERAGYAERRQNDGPGARPREDDYDDCPNAVPSVFKTASEQLSINNQKKFGGRGGGGAPTPSAYGTNKKSLGSTRRGLNSKFVPPVINRDDEDAERGHQGAKSGVGGRSKVTGGGEEEVTDERLKGIDPKMIELIANEIMDHGPPIHWDDIAGLEFAKTTIKEIVVWPMLRPDIFTGLRGPPKGLLLFGPPGTGKTLIGKCIACQSGATFFSISASSLTSKWVGEGEKMVRALFAVARCNQPAVIFIDEIDSLLSQRSNDEHESSRRIKTEFLVQLDGATTSSEDRLLVVGATNRPQEIDEAARRRLVKRLYIPLPEALARKQIVQNLLTQQSYSLTEDELDMVCVETDGYSGADMANLCREAALGPIRCIQGTDIQFISADQVRPILYQDFHGALQHMRPSVSKSDLDIYLEWNKTFGSGASK